MDFYLFTNGKFAGVSELYKEIFLDADSCAIAARTKIAIIERIFILQIRRRRGVKTEH